MTAGPVDVLWYGSDVSQDFVLTDVAGLSAGATRMFCVRLDVNANALLDGNSLYVKLLPFEQGDVVLTGDGPELPLDRIMPSTALWTSFVLAGPDGPLVPHAAPTVSAASLPTTTLPNAGTVIVRRMTITARAEADVQVKKLSYQDSISTADPSGVSLLSPGLRRVGEGTDLPGVSHVEWGGGVDCGFVSSWSNRCIRIVLDEPLMIAAGTSVTVELRLTMSAAFTSGDSLTRPAS